MANVPPRVAELIETFDRNIDAYRSQQYNEAQLRREFIDPFFEELGWDVTNKQGYAQAYKEVIHEDAIKVGGATKAPDYCFRFGGTRKFFLEAKKPSIDIKGDPHPAYQLRRYAWSALVSHFAEFSFYKTEHLLHDYLYMLVLFFLPLPKLMLACNRDNTIVVYCWECSRGRK